VLAQRPWRTRAGTAPQWLRRRAGSGRGRLAAASAAWPALAGLALGLLAVGPALAPGYILSYDMVFLPHAPISAATIGLAGGPPRAVPSDAVIAALSAVLPADVLQKIILVAIFTAACAGAARLLGRCAQRTGRAAPLPARLAAGVCYAWNPYVAERLIIGHWALLLGYAALPWAVAAAWAGHPPRPQPADRPGPQPAGRPGPQPGPTAAAGRWRWAARLGGTLIPAAVGGYAAVGVCALAVLPAAAAGPGGRAARARRLALAAAVLGVASLPWLIPSLLVAVHTDPRGADAFAARPDTPFGGAGSLLMLGGIWNAQVVPRGYGGAGSAVWLAVVLIALASFALLGGRARASLGLAAIVSFAVAAAGLTSGSRAALRHLIAAWPGFGVLRDGQQFIAPLALAEAIGLGLAVAWILARVAAAWPRDAAPDPAPGPAPGGGARGAAVALAIMAVVAPVVLLPGLAWGAAGRLHATAYPADWLAARRLIDADPRPGSAVLLPWAAYRRFAWNDGQAVLDPWTKLLRRPVIWNDALEVGALTVAAEDPRARRLTPVIAGTGPLTGPLRAAGARYVIVDAGPLLGAGRRPRAGARGGLACLAGRARLPGAAVVLASGDLIVFRLPAAAIVTAAGTGANPTKGTTCPAAGR
jgi:hypothetical protein